MDDLQAEAQAKQKREQLLLKAAYQQVMGSKDGRKIMWRQLERCGIYRSSFSQDALVMAHNEGGRNIGLQLLAELQAFCPDEVELMMREVKND